MKNTLFIILVSFIICGCKRYRVDENSIKGRGLNNGFAIDQLVVNSVDEEGKPLSYYTDTSVSVEIIEPNGNLKKIYFNKPSEKYYWLFFKPISVQHYDVLPFKFSPNKWYYISRLYVHGSPDYGIYIYVDAKGDFTTYHDYKPGPF